MPCKQELARETNSFAIGDQVERKGESTTIIEINISNCG
jgi:hypothetical protein